MTHLDEGLETLEELAPMPTPPEQGVVNPDELTTAADPTPRKHIDHADEQLYQTALQTIHDLQVEIKTVQGFTVDHLCKKYKFESQEEFNKYFK